MDIKEENIVDDEMMQYSRINTDNWDWSKEDEDQLFYWYGW